MTEPIRLSRRGFLGATMAAAASAGLAASNTDAFASAGAKTSPLVVHDWAYYQKDFTGFKAYFQKYGVPKYITFNTDQAELARAASGAITYDITHPCIAYIPDWQAAGLIGPIDRTKFEAFSKVNKQLAQPGIVNGKTYGIPWDWGYSTPMYRGDKYVPSSQSWEAVLFDKKLRGKVTMYDEGVAMIKIGALINGHQNVNTLTAKQIAQSRDTMIKAKANIVSFWQSETQAMQDFISGKVWVTYAWPDTYAQVVAKPSMKNAKVVYMQPKEGQLAWICAFAIAAKPKNEDLAYAYLNTAYSAPAMDFLVNAFFTGGSAMTAATLAKTDPKFVKQFHLNSLSTALKPPKVWLEEHLDNRNAYLKAYQQVKSA
jgi:putative spermidine/putrescine transport system substrate-binding protein/spermidine/putrescine transport system substrate-binding protein